MTDLTSLDEPAIAWRLRIAGLPMRFLAVPERVDVEVEAVPGTDDELDYVDANMLIEPTAWTESIDLIGGLAQSAMISLGILTEELDGALEDAGMILTTLPESADYQAQVTAHVLVDDTTIYIDTDLTALDVPRMMWLGQEAVWVTSIDGSQPDPTVADPYRLTVNRGAAQSRVSAHPADRVRKWGTIVYSDLVAWPGRRAILDAAPIYGPSTNRPRLGEWVEVMRGFLEDSPELSESGDLLTLTLHSLPAAFDFEIEVPPSSTALVQNWHYGDDVAASRFEYGLAIPSYSEFDSTHTLSAAAGGVLLVEVATHQDLFDVTLPAGHPRRGRVAVNGTAETFVVTGYQNAGAGAPNEGYTIDAAQPFAPVQSGKKIGTVRATEIKAVAMPTGLYEWPIAAIDAIHSVSIPDTADGLDGAWLNLELMPAGDGDGWAVALTNTTTTPLHPPICAVLIDPHDQDPLPGSAPPLRGIGWPPNQTAGPAQPIVWTSAGAEIGRADMLTLSYYGWYKRPAAENDQRGGKQHFLVLDGPVPGQRGQASYDGIVSPALAWYQSGEPSALVQGELAAEAPFVVSIEWSEPWKLRDDGGAVRQRQRALVASVESEPLPDGTDAWRLVFDDPDSVRSFGDWPGLEAARITLDIANQSAADLLYELLTDHLGLDDEDINVESLYWFPDPVGFTFGRPTTSEAVELRDVLRGILIATRTALVMRTDSTGTNRLTRVDIGIEVPSDTIASISDDECPDPPTYGANHDTVAHIDIRSNFDAEGSPGLKSQHTHPGIDAEQGRRARSEKIDLYGAIGDQLAHEEVAEQIFELVGRPRRTWSHSLSLLESWKIGLGDVITATSSRLKSYSKTVGVNGAAARVTSITRDPSANRMRMVSVHHNRNGACWAPSALIIETTAADVAIIDPAAYVTENDPLTGMPHTAHDYFPVGSEIYIAERADPDGGGEVGLDAVDTVTDEWTTDAAHGLGVVAEDTDGIATAVPATWDNATAYHQTFAYLADANGKLGAGDDDGFDLT